MRGKVGIVTLYHDNFNFGGLLQAFALHRVIESRGYNCELITFDIVSADHYARRLFHFKFSQAIDAVKRVLASRFCGADMKRMRAERVRAFRKFEKSIPHSDLIGKSDYVRLLEEDYDAVFVGSDQVWNPAWWNDILLLRGVSGKKIVKVSYAASMGCSSLTEEDRIKFSSALVDFAFLSVRERSAGAIIEDATGGVKTAEVTLDPTLLLTRDEWERVLSSIGHSRVPDRPYAFIYMVDKQNRYTKKSIRACVDAGLLPVLVAYSLDRDYGAEIQDEVMVLHDCSPEEWVQLLSKATAVITDSFHGVAFSCNFRKNFWCFRKTETLNGSNKDDRQEALLDRFGLANRIIDADSDLTREMLFDAPKFDVCADELERERQSSLLFIDSCLEAIPSK